VQAELIVFVPVIADHHPRFRQRFEADLKPEKFLTQSF